MEVWQTILIAFGGNMVLLAVLGWLAKAIVVQLLTKDIENFKSSLKAEAEIASQKLQHDLQLVTIEHQIRFSKLHEKRAEVIAELYGYLVQAHRDTASFVSLVEWAGEPSKNEKYVTCMNSVAEFYRFFEKQKIYLPEVTCKLIDDFVMEMRSEAIGFGVYVQGTNEYMPDHVLKEKLEAWSGAWKFFEQKVPVAKSALENELRKILGGPGGVSS